MEVKWGKYPLPVTTKPISDAFPHPHYTSYALVSEDGAAWAWLVHGKYMRYSMRSPSDLKGFDFTTVCDLPPDTPIEDAKAHVLALWRMTG